MNESVLKEFLVKLGFQVDRASMSKMDGALGKITASVLSLTKSLIGVVVAAETMVLSFGKSMEKLYYTSKQTKESVGHLQAFSRAAAQIGIDGDSAVESLSRFNIKMLESQGGLQTLLKGLGVHGNGEIETFINLIDTLKTRFGEAQFGTASAYASNFGISSEDLLSYFQNMDEFKKKYGSTKDLDSKDKKAKDLRDYVNSSRDLSNEMYDLGLKLAGSDGLLPVLKDLTGYLKTIAGWANDKTSTPVVPPGFVGPPAPKQPNGFLDRLLSGQLPSEAIHGYQGPKKSDAEIMADAERKYGLPTGMLSRLRHQESSDGRQLRIAGTHFDRMTGKMVYDRDGKEAASGQFMFLPSTGHSHGLHTQSDFDDLYKSSDAAGKFLADLYKKNKSWTGAANDYGGWTGVDTSSAHHERWLNGVLGNTPKRGGIVQNNTINMDVKSNAPVDELSNHLSKVPARVHADISKNLGAVVK